MTDFINSRHEARTLTHENMVDSVPWLAQRSMI